MGWQAIRAAGLNGNLSHRALAAEESAPWFRGLFSRVLKNSFFDALRPIQGWIANFNEFQLGEIVRSARIHFWPIVVEKSQDGFFQHPVRSLS